MDSTSDKGRYKVIDSGPNTGCFPECGQRICFSGTKMLSSRLPEILLKKKSATRFLPSN